MSIQMICSSTSLRVAVTNYMTRLFQILVNDPSQINRLDQNRSCNNMAVAITGVVHEINTTDVYVDQQALTWWLAAGGNMARYRQVHQSVAEMYSVLTHTQRAEVIAWVRSLYRAYESINSGMDRASA